ncbi:MAG: LamG domain-containing protein [Sedimentisphaerales bacterium]|nr:LamG domain-containing protein [Sedimentisphaerales bacterium]
MRERLISLSTALMVAGWCSLGFAAATDPNLVGWWQLDDGDGPIAADSSGKSVDGELFGDPTWSTDGMNGGCLLFDGTDDYIFINGGFKLRTYTMAVWFRADGAGQRDIISAYAPGVLHGILLEVGSDGKLRFLHRYPLDTGGGANIYSTATFSDGAWHHAAITKSPTDITLYVDKQQIGTMPDTSVFDPTDSFGVALGILDNEREAARQWLGAMDDVRIYNRALAAEEVQALVPPRLQAYKPDPPDGTIGVNVALLGWTKGETAVFHNVYLGTRADLTADDLKAPRFTRTAFYYAPGLEPGQTYYWRVDEIEKDGVTTHTGRVWSFVAQDVAAYYPNPLDKANTVPLAPTLTWQAGLSATEHQVYFSSSLDAVNQGAAEADRGKLPLEETAFVPGALEGLTTYYWRVDEVFFDEITAGNVWSFTTCQPVDDFGSYTNDVGSRVFQTWIDGLGYSEPAPGNPGNGTGAIVGYDPELGNIMETKIVHGGLQSMPVEYNNVNSPFYSEAERPFTDAQDWTAGAADTLVLYVRGRLANGLAPLYVALEDAAKHVAVVAHPDSAVVTAVKWVEWKIPFTQLIAANVDLARVKKLYIGVGDRGNPQPGATGRMYIDDICLTRSP